MKTILCLTLLTATVLHSQDYSSQWSEFDGGNAAVRSGGVAHAGVFSGWLRTPMKSASYQNQQVAPLPVQTANGPLLTINLEKSSVRISWPDSTTGFVLQRKSAFDVGGTWEDIAGPYSLNGDEQFLLVPAAKATEFYRLRAVEAR